MGEGRLPRGSWGRAPVPLALVLAACSGSFMSRMEDATGCPAGVARHVLAECLSERFAGSDPADVDRVLTGTGLVRGQPGTYVYSGGYSYALTVFVQVRSGKVARVDAI